MEINYFMINDYLLVTSSIMNPPYSSQLHVRNKVKGSKRKYDVRNKLNGWDVTMIYSGSTIGLKAEGNIFLKINCVTMVEPSYFHSNNTMNINFNLVWRFRDSLYIAIHTLFSCSNLRYSSTVMISYVKLMRYANKTRWFFI